MKAAIYPYLLFLLLFGQKITAQKDTLRFRLPTSNEDIIEDFIQNEEEETAFDFNTIFEQLQQYSENPLNLNTATEAELKELGLLSDQQIVDFFFYRQKAGKLVALYELQSIPSFDLTTIHRMLPYVQIGGNYLDYPKSFGTMVIEGNNELYLRWTRNLEKKKGFQIPASDTAANRFLGDQNKLYLRFKHSNGTRLSYGFTAEKDAGEEFLKGSNKQGFDFYSAHFFFKDFSQLLKAVAIGDYTVNLGQGLVLFSGFSSGKSAATLNVKKVARTIRPYSGVNEFNFLRGLATTLRFGENLEWTAFFSHRKRDGNLDNLDISGTNDLEMGIISSLQTSGFHRTQSEIEDEKSVKKTTLGSSLKYKTEHWHISLNSLFDKLNRPLRRRPQLYNQFFFNGDKLLNFSLDYSFLVQNFNFFGETAMSDNGAVASLNGLLLGLDKSIALTIVQRHFPKDYQALNDAPFAETSGARNENGLYFGLEITPSQHWKFNAYLDTWQHPWLRFRVDAPSKGYEWLTRLTLYQKRKWEVYFQVRNELKELNLPGSIIETLFDFSNKTTQVVERQTFKTRLHISHNLTKALTWKTRVEVGFTKYEEFNRSHGFSIYQDLLFRPLNFPLSFSTRFAIVDTDSFDIRFNNYENDLKYAFSIPAYFNEGTRFYINLRYKGTRHLTIEARFAQTYWANQKSFGSGLDEIRGQRKSEVKAQLSYSF